MPAGLACLRRDCLKWRCSPRSRLSTPCLAYNTAGCACGERQACPGPTRFSSFLGAADGRRHTVCASCAPQLRVGLRRPESALIGAFPPRLVGAAIRYRVRSPDLFQFPAPLRLAGKLQRNIAQLHKLEFQLHGSFPVIHLEPASVHSGSMTATSMSRASGKTIMKYRAQQTHLHVKASEDVAGRVCKFLRQRHPRKTAEEVSAETGLAATTVSSWMDRSTVPGGIAFIALIHAYGPEFLAAVMPSAPRWLDKAYREERQAHLEAQSERIRQEIADLQQ